MKRYLPHSLVTTYFAGVVLITPGIVMANDPNWGAYITRPVFTQESTYRFLLPPEAEVVIVNASQEVYSAIRAGRTGEVTKTLSRPEGDGMHYTVFYGDGRGMSREIPFNFSHNQLPILLPPTLYGIPNINGVFGSLGFVGKSHPSSQLILEISLSTNEKITKETLANEWGEWQILPPKLPPGKHTARARTIYKGMESDWSQEMSVMVLAPTDQFIQDLGYGTRRSLENVIDRMPGPLREVATGLDSQSDLATKYVLPTLFTLTTITQSGILAQNLLYLLFQAILAVGQAMGLIKKRQPTGVVYDAITKRPLGRVIVRLYEAQSHRLVETDVTSATGTFSFMPSEGYYYLRVSKPGYIFPSQLIMSKRDGRYTSVYTGGELHIYSGSAVVDAAVPLDPEAYQEAWWMRLQRSVQRWYEPLNQWLLLLGVFLAFLSYTRQPTRLNFVVLWLYLFGIVYFWWQGRRFKRDYGLVVNSTGKPLSGVELILTDVEYNRLVSRRVTDEKGRFQFIVPPGKYQIRVVSTGWELVTSVKRAYNGEEVTVEGERGHTKHLVPRIVVKQAS